MAIDNALSQSPANFEELLKLLQESGCEVSKRGKSYRLKLPGWEKAARVDSLGEGYGVEELRAVLSGKKAHTPRKKTVTQAEPPKVNLLVDIQAKLQAGKGAGYARWAKVFNLKQMAQTMNYLSEHNLLEYAILEEKAAAATAHHNELSAQIKAAEKRMAEIAVLRTHIVNYAKTREVYVAYRKAGYSKKFREEHEEEILLHQAGALGVCDHIRTVHLHQIRFEPEAGLTGTGAADHQHIFVSGGLGVLGAAIHGQALGFRQNHIVLKYRVDVGSNILTGSPTGRAILQSMPILLGVFTFEVHRQTQASSAA